MSRELDQILDECLDRVFLRGETIEACLALYPQMREELEPLLRTAVQAAQATAFTPSAEAKTRWRQRLHDYRRDLRAKEQARKGWRMPDLFGPRLRLLTVSMAAVLVIALGGFSVISASGSALPGDALYPVKLAVERWRLAFEFSDSGKAELHVTYAERRADEIGTLVTSGDPLEAQSAQEDLKNSLAVAAEIAGKVENEQEVAVLKQRIETTASEALATLQTAVEQAPEESRDAATDAFIASSEAFGETIESVSASSSVQIAASTAVGTLSFWAIDPPPPGVEAVLVQVEGVEAHLVTGGEGRWVTITEEPETFDLLKIAEVQRFLGEQQVESGTYTKIRFHITKATVVVEGVEHEADFPRDRLDLTRPIRVQEGETTSVFIDFDGLRSLVVTDGDKFALKPVIRVLAEEPEQRDTKPDQAAEQEQSEGREETSEQKTPKRRAKVEVVGRIEELTADGLTVKGKRFILGGDTEVEGELAIGLRIKIEAAIRPDGSLLATEIKSENAKEREQDREDEEGKETDGSKDSKGSVVETSGEILALSPTEWTVGGDRAFITPETKITGEPSVGAQARVQGLRQDDGAIVARVIAVRMKQEEKPSRKPERVTVTGRIEAIEGDSIVINGVKVVITGETEVEGQPALGALAAAVGERQPDGTVVAAVLKVRASDRDEREEKPAETPTKESGEVQQEQPIRITVAGVLEFLDGFRWRIGDRTIVISKDTRIEGGLITPGASIQVEGAVTKDGTIIVSKIRVLGGPNISQSPTPTPEPRKEAEHTPTATPARPTATATPLLEPTQVRTPPTPTAALPTPINVPDDLDDLTSRRLISD